MKLKQILQEIEKVDEDVYSLSGSRRRVLRELGVFTKKAAFAALPFSLATKATNTQAQSINTAAIEAVLQFALTIKQLEAEFYTLAISSAGLVPAGAAFDAITTFRDHENLHVAFLATAIEDLGKVPGAKPVFDFEGGKGISGGVFPDVFTNFDTFLVVAQMLEDTGVRAFKGQITELVGAGSIITGFLGMHSVEGRHASHVRRMRMLRGASIKPWITGKVSGIGAAAQLSYDGEELAIQGGISIAEINGLSISIEAASESFDEPLTKEQTLTIIDPFLV